MKRSLLGFIIVSVLLLSEKLYAEDYDCSWFEHVSCGVRSYNHTIVYKMMLKSEYRDKEIDLYVDSIWITGTEDHTDKLIVSNAQPEEEIDISILESNRLYFLWVQFSDCLFTCLFSVRYVPTDIQDVDIHAPIPTPVVKLLHEGKLFIRREDKIYNAQGVRVE